MAAKGKFKYGTIDVNMTLGYVLATGKLEDLGFDVLSVLSDGHVLETLLLNDKILLKIWHMYVLEETGDDWETAIETLDSTQGGLTEFRENFFTLVVNFSPPQARKLLIEMWEQMKSKLKNSQEMKSLISSSSSQEEQESNQEISQ